MQLRNSLLSIVKLESEELERERERERERESIHIKGRSPVIQCELNLFQKYIPVTSLNHIQFLDWGKFLINGNTTDSYACYSYV